MRKTFDHTTGKHVAVQPSLPSTDDILEPAPHVVKALTVKCPICNALPGEKCGSIIDASHYFEVPHPGRIEAARSEPDV